MAKGKRTRVLLDAWDGIGRDRTRADKRRIKVLPGILNVSLHIEMDTMQDLQRSQIQILFWSDYWPVFDNFILISGRYR